jgi:hypothetical protein
VTSFGQIFRPQPPPKPLWHQALDYICSLAGIPLRW